MLNDRLYNRILSQFKITVIFNHITAKHSRSDIYESDQFSVQQHSFVLTTVHRMTNVPYMEHNDNE